MTQKLTLISHHLCPYVQRAVIALTEKNVLFERVYVDLANKPTWFRQLSPFAKTPVLVVGDTAIFESAVILEYLEDTQPHPLHPKDPLNRAEHRSWIEFGSSILNDIGGFYSAPNAQVFNTKANTLSNKFKRIEERISSQEFFDGNQFQLIDAVYAPIFRYFDVFDRIGDFAIMNDKPKVIAWRNTLAARHSIQTAVGNDYEVRLLAFLDARNSYLTQIMTKAA